jgi:hypothetical protein
MKLRHNEYCLIHRSLSCCGRELTHRARRLQPSVRRVEDPHHPRGYRELRSPAEMRKLLKRKVREQNGICAICHHEFTDYNDIAPDHRDPKGMGALGEMIIRIIFKQHIGGAMGKKDQPEWMADDQSTAGSLRIDRYRRRIVAIGSGNLSRITSRLRSFQPAPLTHVFCAEKPPLRLHGGSGPFRRGSNSLGRRIASLRRFTVVSPCVRT